MDRLYDDYSRVNSPNVVVPSGSERTHIEGDIIGCTNPHSMVNSRFEHFLEAKKFISVRDRAPGPFYDMLGQTHVNGWSRVIASQNGGSTSYIFPLRLGVLQWSRHLFNYWKNKKTIIEKFLILLI